MDIWTKEELETLAPFESAFRQIGNETVQMTREEYDAWISRSVGTPKPEPDDLGA